MYRLVSGAENIMDMVMSMCHGVSQTRLRAQSPRDSQVLTLSMPKFDCV